MFVVDVCTLRVPSTPRESAGRPVRSSVMATNDAHVAAAYSRIVSSGVGAARAGGATVVAVSGRASAVPSAVTGTGTRKRRIIAASRVDGAPQNAPLVEGRANRVPPPQSAYPRRPREVLDCS